MHQHNPLFISYKNELELSYSEEKTHLWFENQFKILHNYLLNLLESSSSGGRATDFLVDL